VVYIISTWIFPPFHPFRSALATLVEPALRPIRSVVPPLGMFDFSAFILIVLIEVVAAILIAVLR
jgi:YggT family protein